MVDSTQARFSTSEVAKALGISPSLVRTWVAYMNWEVTRNAEGHRVFSAADVEQLQELKAWLDAGNTMREFRREQQDEGPYDPRTALRGGYRRLKELSSQQEALVAKQHELLEAFEAQRLALDAQMAAMRGAVEPGGASVQAVLKQLLTALLEKQGKLQLVRRFEEDGRPRLEYAAPGGRTQVVEDVCATSEDRALMERVLSLILTDERPLH